MAVVGYVQGVNGVTDAVQSGVPLGYEIPATSQIAIVFVRCASSDAMSSFTTTFGTATILAQDNSGDSNSYLVAVTVDDTGSGHTFSATYANDGAGGFVYSFVFIDGVDTSSQAAWLRDAGAARAYGGDDATITIDTRAEDIVLVATGSWNNSPPTISGTTSLLAPNATYSNRVRVSQVDEPDNVEETFMHNQNYSSVAAVSIIPLSMPRFVLLPPLMRYTGSNFTDVSDESVDVDIYSVNQSTGKITGLLFSASVEIPADPEEHVELHDTRFGVPGTRYAVVFPYIDASEDSLSGLIVESD